MTKLVLFSTALRITPTQLGNIFHALLSDTDFGITFNCRPIKRVFEFKYLGVVFDEHISWNSHVISMYYRELVND